MNTEKMIIIDQMIEDLYGYSKIYQRYMQECNKCAAFLRNLEYQLTDINGVNVDDLTNEAFKEAILLILENHIETVIKNE